MKIVNYLKRQPKWVLVALAVVLVLSVGAVDWLTGPDLSFSIFFLIPICFSVWLAGKPAGIAVSLLSAVTWLTIELLWDRQYAHPLIPYWNAAVRLGFFLVISFLLSALRDQKETLERGVKELTAENTERIRAEEQLRVSEQRFRQLAETIGEVFWLSNPEKTEIIYVSPGYEKIWGRNCDSLRATPRSWLDAIHPDDRERVQQAAMTKQAKGDYDEEYRITRPDDSVRWIRDRAFPVCDAAGNIYRIAGFAEDITERKRAEAVSGLQSQVTRNMEEGVALVRESDAVIVYANPKFERMFGYRPGELIGQPIQVVNAQSKRRPEDIAAEIIGSLRKTGAWSGEVHNRKKDGTEFWCSANVGDFDHPEYGKVWIAIHADITERKLAEQALYDSEARMRGIVETAADGIITIDERGIIQSCNRAAEVIFGYEAAEATGRNVSILMPEPYGSEHDGHIANYLRTGHKKVIGIGREVVGKRKDGTTFPLDLSVGEVQLGKGRLFAGIVRDVTDRKRMETEVLSIGERERIRIGNDLHDGLCQRLVGAAFVANRLEGRLQEKSIVEVSDVQKISALLDDAITEARTIAGGLHPVAMDAQGLAFALREVAIHTSRVSKISCQFNSPSSVLVADNVIATHLYRIAQEAVNNAINHGQATEISIELTSDPKNLVTLKVADNGIGLAKSPKRSGGMGIAIMQYRARAIGGTLEIQPGPVRGTAIVCSFQQTSGT